MPKAPQNSYGTVYHSGKAAQKSTNPAFTHAKKTAREKAVRKESVRLTCPHCLSPAVIRSSAQITILTRESNYQCTNPECSHGFIALTEIVRTTALSSRPNLAINLPLAETIKRTKLLAVLKKSATATHKSKFKRAVSEDLFDEDAFTD